MLARVINLACKAGEELLLRCKTVHAWRRHTKGMTQVFPYATDSAANAAHYERIQTPALLAYKTAFQRRRRLSTLALPKGGFEHQGATARYCSFSSVSNLLT